MGAGIRIQEPDIYSVLYDHERRLKNQETFGDERWIYVGTVGVDGVDDLLTPDSPPFENFWTNTLGVESPVSFRRTMNGWVHMRGGFTGGFDNSIIFTLPPGFRPEYDHPMILPTTYGAIANCIVQADGGVMFLSVA